MQPRQYKATISLYKAIIHFLNEGYLVFENISEQGPIDIIIVNPENGKATFIDVKTNKPKLHNKSGDQGGKLKPKQKELGVRLCYVKGEEVWLPKTKYERELSRGKKGTFSKQPKEKRVDFLEDN
jgi:hypothetical protein|tara:strand:+ start:94 stop:468 length:375 start_codon:yes stop_codon:yes gene_type:complete